jgi:serine/threonine protein kinase
MKREESGLAVDRRGPTSDSASGNNAGVGAPTHEKFLENCGYINVSYLGKGRYGVVYRAEKNGEVYAVKVNDKHEAGAEDRIPRIKANIAKIIQEQASGKAQRLVHIPDRTQEDEAWLAVPMRLYVRSLADVLYKRKLTLHEKLGLLWQAGQCLAEAHRLGFVHRDVKPANFLLDEQNQVVLSDIDTMHTKVGETLTKNGTGTGDYWPPEGLFGWYNEKRDHRHDVFAFGCMIYEFLTGRLPNSNEKIACIEGPIAPSSLQKVLALTLCSYAKIHTMGKVVAQLEKMYQAEERVVYAGAVFTIHQIGSKYRKLLAVVVVACLLFALWSWWKIDQADKQNQQLQDRLVTAESQKQALAQEYQALLAQCNRKTYISKALAVTGDQCEIRTLPISIFQGKITVHYAAPTPMITRDFPTDCYAKLDQRFLFIETNRVDSSGDFYRGSGDFYRGIEYLPVRVKIDEESTLHVPNIRVNEVEYRFVKLTSGGFIWSPQDKASSASHLVPIFEVKTNTWKCRQAGSTDSTKIFGDAPKEMVAAMKPVKITGYFMENIVTEIEQIPVIIQK